MGGNKTNVFKLLFLFYLSVAIANIFVDPQAIAHANTQYRGSAMKAKSAQHQTKRERVGHFPLMENALSKWIHETSSEGFLVEMWMLPIEGE